MEIALTVYERCCLLGSDSARREKVRAHLCSFVRNVPIHPSPPSGQVSRGINQPVTEWGGGGLPTIPSFRERL